MRPATYQDFDAVTRLHLAIFLKRVFNELNPGTEFLDNFHLHVLIDELEKLRHGNRRRLAVAMPPRSLKSLLISVAYVAWLLGHDPSLRIICVSYGQELADKLASDCRQIMQTDWYKRMFPGTRLAPNRQALGNFETTAGGGRFSTSVGGVLTGFGADFIIVDDPSKPSESLSDAERRTINDWVQHTLFTRLNDKRRGRILIVMQRLHQDDVIGNLIEKTQGDFKILTFAAIAEIDEVHTHKTAFGIAHVVRKAGEALHSAREPLEVLEEQRRLLGSRFFAAQYLQSPTPAEGNIVKRQWLRRYAPADIISPDRVFQSWDTASKCSDSNDYSACVTAAVKGQQMMILDVFRGRLEMPALKQKVMELFYRWNPQRVLIEDKGSGMALLQELRASDLYNTTPIIPKGDKRMRLEGVTPMIEGGDLYLPDHALWLEPFEDELCAFPAGRYDDQVDALSQLLNWTRQFDATPAIIEFYRQEVEAQRARLEDRTELLVAPHGVSHHIGSDGFTRSIASDRTIWLTQRDAASVLMAGWHRAPPRRPT